VYFDDKALDWEESVWLFWHDTDTWVVETNDANELPESDIGENANLQRYVKRGKA
jgi:hypothetical protein